MSPRLVIVEWDSSAAIAAWQGRAEIADMATNRAWHCRNVGWLVHEDTECVVVAARLSESGDYAGLTERIPRRAVVSMHDVYTAPIVVQAGSSIQDEQGNPTAGIDDADEYGPVRAAFSGTLNTDMAAIRRVATRGSD